MAIKKNRFISTVITLIVIIFSGWLAGEITLRLYCMFTGKGGYIWIPDDHLGVRLAPNSRFVYSLEFTDEYRVRRKTNSLGLIGEEISVKKPANTTRILVLGDSFTDGLHVDEGKNFCEQLQFLLNQNSNSHSKRFEVINAGVGGSSPVAEYLFFKRELSKLDPDIVILQMFANDVFEDNKTGAMSVFNTKGMPVKINKYFMQKYLDKPVVESEPTRFEELTYEIKKFFVNRSIFFQYLTRLPRQFYKKARIHREMTNRPEYNDENQFFIIQGYNPLFKDTSFRNKAWANTKKYISVIKDLAGENNARFLLFHIPLERQLKLESYSEHSLALFLQAPNYYLSEKLTELSREENIAYLDLLRTFEEAKDKKLYYGKDGHTNTVGHALIAQALFDFMREKDYVTF